MNERFECLVSGFDVFLVPFFSPKSEAIQHFCELIVAVFTGHTEQNLKERRESRDLKQDYVWLEEMYR